MEGGNSMIKFTKIAESYMNIFHHKTIHCQVSTNRPKPSKIFLFDLALTMAVVWPWKPNTSASYLQKQTMWGSQWWSSNPQIFYIFWMYAWCLAYVYTYSLMRCWIWEMMSLLRRTSCHWLIKRKMQRGLHCSFTGRHIQEEVRLFPMYMHYLLTLAFFIFWSICFFLRPLLMFRIIYKIMSHWFSYCFRKGVIFWWFKPSDIYIDASMNGLLSVCIAPAHGHTMLNHMVASRLLMLYHGHVCFACVWFLLHCYVMIG